MKNILVLISLFISLTANAELLDKILAIYDDQPILLSQLKRIQSNVAARRNISPQIFNKAEYSLEELAKMKIRSMLIRAKLSEMGYIVSDDQVEASIKGTEERLGLNRAALLNFLKNNDFSFDEYFELIRESQEFGLYVSRVIQPLISITDQDLKNAYYQKYSNKKSLSFSYNLVDFSISEDALNKEQVKQLKPTLVDFQQNGVLPEVYSSLTTNELGDLSEESLIAPIKKSLVQTKEGDFSNPIILGGSYHVFYVKKKDLVESTDYLEKKNEIYSELFQKNIDSISQSWFNTEIDKHYVKYFFES